ncbi:DUF1295-domain-containing protein [Pseudovirgaria hyperparasitica]|uniref:DUF1295-domain-containing protein n=1 Tax=Pseudovirgaria hyperparasitica TaxID=470096 RepID=A0A6A6W626_9PEZI|nr:DUF1295-domain-containing protein [Pseudovirgaria hyperparasitica]KAF2758063.1 DUF1295-domain-containing protein [Pseudovirgaria hyperparasitica]
MLFFASALPAVKTLADCTSYTKTVAPFVPQLKTLPQQVWAHISNTDDLVKIYTNTNPLITAIAFALALAPIFLLLSEINKNYSQVDRVWSILPAVYNGHYALWAHLNGLPTQRLDNLLAFSVVWSLRLTFNYWRRGGYQIGSEDYRWEIVKNKVGPALMFIFNVVFISLAQSILLMMITMPTYVLMIAAKHSQPDMSFSDIVFARVLMGLVLLEFFADQQQWNYQGAKKQYRETAKVPPGYLRSDLDRGFISTGLWSFSRHPNFLAEQSIWVVLYQWSCFATDQYYNWAGIGALSYLFLFQASTWLTELLTAGKYPEYKTYQAKVGRFLPKLRALSTVPFEDEAEFALLEKEAQKKLAGAGAGAAASKKGKKK